MPQPIDLNNFDRTIKPTDDFFHYVNGGWLKNNPIPVDESRWGSFYTLRFVVEGQLKAILDEVAARNDVSVGCDEQKVRDFYRSAMDVARRNEQGISPLKDIFKLIDAIAENDLFDHSLMQAVGALHRMGIVVFWQVYVGQDEKNSEVMALNFYQGGLGLPDRDYYLNDDEKSRAIRADYLAYMKDMLARAGFLENAAIARAAEVVMAIETRLAKASLSRVELRDVEKMYNKVTLAQFAVLAPKIDLPKYFGATPSLREPSYLIVGQPKFFTELNEIFEGTALEDIKIYLRWHVLNSMSVYLSEEFERRNFDFYGRTFTGAAEMKPLWRRALKVTDVALDELLGKLYVARHFGEDAKKKIKNLVEHLSVAYRARIEKLDWMSSATKQKALEKLGTVTKKLGYPDVWKDFSLLAIDSASSFADNVMRAYTFEFDRKMREVGGSVNREEWLMSPQTVNAYYMPPMNDIVFPAAILQPPFFDPSADDAVNFGGIGAVIGHELTHGFDDQGSRFDSHGNLNEWWTKEDKERFDAKAAHLAEQFDKYEAVPGVHVNGKLTLGENIADLGGLLIAYDGLKLKLAEEAGAAAPGAAAPQIDGFTPEQRFFIGAAIAEGSQVREQALRLQVQVDPHSPSVFRVNGPLSNMSEFYEAFEVKQGDELFRELGDRVDIW